MGFSRQQIVPVGDACEKTADAVALLKASACKFQHRDLSKRRQLLEMRGRQSTRTFARRVHAATGMSPIRFLQQLRMERAIEMLETTSLPFEEVAYRVGYRDPSTLRAVIRQRLGVGPRELRHRARSASAAKSIRGRSEAA